MSNQPDNSEKLLMGAFARVDQKALGFALGVWAGTALFLATIILVLKDGYPVGPTLGLLSQYFPGYTVTWTGSLVGLLYGFVSGFSTGWLIAFLRNSCIFAFIHITKLKSEMHSLNDYIDNP